MELFQCGTHIRLLLPYMPIHTPPVKCGIYLTARTHVCLDQPHLMCSAATPGSRLQNWTAQTARLQQASPGGTQWQSKRVTLGNNTFSGCWYQRPDASKWLTGLVPESFPPSTGSRLFKNLAGVHHPCRPLWLVSNTERKIPDVQQAGDSERISVLFSYPMVTCNLVKYGTGKCPRPDPSTNNRLTGGSKATQALVGYLSRAGNKRHPQSSAEH